MARERTWTVRGLVVLLVVGGLALQLVIPGAAAGVARTFPEVTHLVVPYSLAAIAAIACLQVALVAVWFLVASPRPLTSPSRWIATCGVAAATAISAVVLVHLSGPDGTGGPLPVLFLLASVVCGTGLTAWGLLAGRALDEASVFARPARDLPPASWSSQT
ncbi:DUF2975 domain-containing protein [Cellulomonas sp. PhB150]|uniref:DUF2975 domain-containing protein n=1 Tax=Cellulomonas sp. PhB150 TaxID=2485188 RepID=UPI000F4A9B21|nr:DUF2975 domain-containing protein [Cellulomonas sp. PhB150]ROS23915.1 hypothetical protein EDF34_2978 [Cellulomonas sp. PhB150]